MLSERVVNCMALPAITQNKRMNPEWNRDGSVLFRVESKKNIGELPSKNGGHSFYEPIHCQGANEIGREFIGPFRK